MKSKTETDMNDYSTIEKMKQMRLKGMAEYHYRAIQNKLHRDYTTDQYLALLVDMEWESRQDRKMNALIKAAGFKTGASITDIDYSSPRNLDRNYFERLAGLGFIKNRENIIITGATGTGKSYLAQALGHQACINMYRAMYFNISKLMERIRISRLEGSYTKFMAKVERTELLILDDFGLYEFDNTSRHALMDIVETKHDRSSIILASQIPVKMWHDLIGEGTIADAILDRIVNSSHRIELEGESMRRKRLEKLK